MVVTRFGIRFGPPLAALLLASTLAPTGALAQPAGGLAYTQALSPEAVRQVQERLRQTGAYQGRVDGVWGPDSQAALDRFQQSRGLQVTGQLNPATVTTLGLNAAELVAVSSATGGPAVAPGSVGGGGMGPLSPAAVRNVQARLRALGFYGGGVDGIWGPRTQSAIERFQQGRGLQVTGQLNPTTVSAMGLDPNNLLAPYR
jgi:peptidoglycan hydrolase-like protein with peptidoglycan-binding domain